MKSKAWLLLQHEAFSGAPVAGHGPPLIALIRRLLTYHFYHARGNCWSKPKKKKKKHLEGLLSGQLFGQFCAEWTGNHWSLAIRWCHNGILMRSIPSEPGWTSTYTATFTFLSDASKCLYWTQEMLDLDSDLIFFIGEGSSFSPFWIWVCCHEALKFWQHFRPCKHPQNTPKKLDGSSWLENYSA